MLARWIFVIIVLITTGYLGLKAYSAAKHIADHVQDQHRSLEEYQNPTHR